MFILRLFVLRLRVLGISPNFVSNACPIAYPKDDICSGGRPYYYGRSFLSLWGVLL